MAVLFVFVDGIGLGEDREENPLASGALESFSHFTNGNGIHRECAERSKGPNLFRKIDANLGIEGLPQSGTGQTSLFTGENASSRIGKHFGPYPHSRIKPLLKKKSLFRKMIDRNRQPHFLNAYPDIFFRKAEQKNRWSCTTLMAKSAGIRLNRLDDIVEGRAVTAEINQESWRKVLKLDVPVIEPGEAAIRALKALDSFDLVLFEYYLTDKAGHEQNRKKADRILHILDRFLYTILMNIGNTDTFVLSSDHGNLEDLSVKTHTRNPVPLLVKGKTEPFIDASSILDVTPAILEVLEG